MNNDNKKTVAINQPNFLPYIGTFQLINKVNTYVFYDDVQYFRGFINRNAFYYAEKIRHISIPLKKASQNKKICDLETNIPFIEILKKIRNIYLNSKYYKDLDKILNKLSCLNEKMLHRLNGEIIKVLSDHFNIKCNFLYSSEINYDKSKVAQDKLINICKLLEANIYINPIGGKSLYSKNIFKKHNIELKFFSPIYTTNLNYLSILHEIAFRGFNFVNQNIRNGCVE